MQRLAHAWSASAVEAWPTCPYLHCTTCNVHVDLLIQGYCTGIFLNVVTHFKTESFFLLGRSSQSDHWLFLRHVSRNLAGVGGVRVNSTCLIMEIICSLKAERCWTNGDYLWTLQYLTNNNWFALLLIFPNRCSFSCCNTIANVQASG